MGWDGAGGYNRTHNFSADASVGIKILASRVDAEFNDFASAIQLAVTRNGQNAPTANIPMGGFRHVGVGAPISATNYIRGQDFIENVPIYTADGESSADRISVSVAYYTTASAATAPRSGSHILIKMGSDKSSAVAIRLNTGDGNPFSANVVLANGSALYSGALRSGGIYEFFWSSSDTAWQLANPQVDYASSAYPGVILLATAAEAAAGTDVPKAVTPAQLADKFSAEYATTTSAGLIEIATTAEVAAGTNASAAVTPSTLNAYASAANVTSAGLIEIATTAEATAGSDTARAITPAALAAVMAKAEPFLAFVSVSNTSGGAEMRSKNAKASAWTVTHLSGVPAWQVTHNAGLASAGELNISILYYGDLTGRTVPLLTSASLSAFSFTLIDHTVTASVANAGAGRIFIQAHRLV